MFKSSLNPYEEIVAKATDEKQTVEAWDVLLTIWDKVNDDGEDGARNCVIALQKRLQHRSANVQLFSLTLADALVNNCNYISRHRLRVYTNLLLTTNRQSCSPQRDQFKGIYSDFGQTSQRSSKLGKHQSI